MEALTASHQLAKFGSHEHYGRDIMILGCQIISLDHAIEGPCNFMGTSPSKVTVLPRLVALGTLAVKI